MKQRIYVAVGALAAAVIAAYGVVQLRESPAKPAIHIHHPPSAPKSPPVRAPQPPSAQDIKAAGGHLRVAATETKAKDICGVVRFEHRYGPPNFGENPKTDMRVPVSVIKLDTPLFINESKLYSGLEEPFIARFVQVMPYLAVKKYAGRRVCLEGDLDARVAPADFYDVVLHLDFDNPERGVTLVPGRRS